MSSIWWQKYRPDNLVEFIGQESIVAEMRSIISDSATMQHFLFHSHGAGTGKTTMAQILAEELGYTLHRFNASSKRTRGIEFIEEELIFLSENGYNETIVLLDEADQLTPSAQSALKGVIETANCYFILTCNDLSKVSQWLQSRCQLRKFIPHTKEDMKDRLKDITVREGYAVDAIASEIDFICNVHTGDLRNAIGALQAVCTMDSDTAWRYLESIGEEFDARRFLRIASTEKCLEKAVKMIEKTNMRSVVRTVFDYATNNPTNPNAVAKVVESAIISERDLVNGVDESIVRWDFTRMLGL